MEWKAILASKVSEGLDLSRKFLLHAKPYDLEIICHEVTAVEPGLTFHTVRLANGDFLNSHVVLLATGASPQKLQVPSEMDYYGQGVSYYAICDGFFFLRENRGCGGRW